MRIVEASTMVTDYLLGTVALALAFLLSARCVPSQGHALSFWAGALLFTGVASFAGGTYHGLYQGLPGILPMALWKGTMAAIGVAAFCFLAGVAFVAVRGRTRHVILAAAAVQLILYLVWIIGHSDFKYVIYNYVPAMLVVLVVEIQVLRRRGSASAPWIIAGILVSFLGVGIQMIGVDLHERFNHNDVYHMLQLIGLYCFFRGGRLLSDR